MARYAIRQKMMTFGDDFAILDEKGSDVFYVDGRAYTFGANLSFHGMDKTELARIKQRLMSFIPTYNIYRAGELAATISKRLMTFRPQFKMTIPTADPKAPDRIQVVGNFIYHDYSFYREKSLVARVSKRIISITDSYGVEIAEGEDDVVFLSAAIVIDSMLHSNKKKKKK